MFIHNKETGGASLRLPLPTYEKLLRKITANHKLTKRFFTLI